jgi:hypothetical protein
MCPVIGPLQPFVYQIYFCITLVLQTTFIMKKVMITAALVSFFSLAGQAQTDQPAKPKQDQGKSEMKKSETKMDKTATPGAQPTHAKDATKSEAPMPADHKQAAPAKSDSKAEKPH